MFQNDIDHGATSARLNSIIAEPGGNSNGWCPSVSDENQWIQIALGFPKWITGVQLQGGVDWQYLSVSQWVTKYKVKYSPDGWTWNFVQDPSTNTDMVSSFEK